MFTFPLSAVVRPVIARGELDAAANGGFRNPHYGVEPGKDEKPGLWLVGDQGAYIYMFERQASGRGQADGLLCGRIQSRQQL